MITDIGECPAHMSTDEFEFFNGFSLDYDGATEK